MSRTYKHNPESGRGYRRLKAAPRPENPEPEELVLVQFIHHPNRARAYRTPVRQR